MKKILLLSLLLVVALGTAFGQSANDYKFIDSFIDSTMKQWQVPGLSVAIVKDGKVVFIKGYGVRNIESGEKVTPNTLFYLASVTKTFTSTLAMLAVDQKKLNIDQPLKTYFPDFGFYDTLASNRITMRDMLCHRTGLPRENFFLLSYQGARKDIRKSMRYFEPTRDFRSGFQYANEPFTVAGDMVAELLGSTWEDQVTKQFLQPLGMDRSVFSYKDMLKSDDYSTPYGKWEGKLGSSKYFDSELLGPAGSLISNANDLSKWLLFHMNKGKVDAQQIISPEVISQLYNPQIPVPSSSKFQEILLPCYGLGWFTDDYRGHLHIHHGGALYGYGSLVSYLPNDRIGVVILANLFATPYMNVLERYIFDKMLGLQSVDWNTRLFEMEKARFEKMKASITKVDSTYKPQSKLKCRLGEYSGEFSSNGFETLKIVQEGDSLYTVLRGIRCPVRHHHDEVFDLYHPEEGDSWKITFISDEKKRVSQFNLDLDNQAKKGIEFKKKI